MPLAFAFALLMLFCVRDASAETASHEKFLRYEIVATHPHDTAAFTQGLAYLGGKLVESTGDHGRSALWLREIATGAPIRRQPLPAQYFGEGVTIAGNRLLQLTWQSGVALLYDLRLQPRGEFRYAGEGWGLAFDGERLLMSDGSDRIAFRRPDDFALIGQVTVADGSRRVTQLNELEYAHGLLYANVWHSDHIAVIDPASGSVQSWIDLAPLRKGFRRPAGWNEKEHVLNGIAFDSRTGHFYVTGKCWPVLYELSIERGARNP